MLSCERGGVPAPAAAPAVLRLRLRLSRTGPACRLSHIEQIERLREAVRSSGLPFVPDGRRSRPRPRLAFGPAIAVGYESRAEYFDLELSAAVEPREASARLAAVLEPGFSVLEARRIPLYFPSLDASINVVCYEIRGPFPAEAASALQALLARSEVVILKPKDGGARLERVDARPLIREMALAAPDRLELSLRFGPKRTVRPEALLQEWLGGRLSPADCRVVRKELWSETNKGELLAP